MTRPTEAPDLTDEDYEHILALYAEGASDVEAKSYIRKKRGSFSNDLWDRWLKEEPKFSEKVNEGKELSQVWWERQGRTNLVNRDFNHNLWKGNISLRFRKDWQETQQVEIGNKDGKPFKTEHSLDEKDLEIINNWRKDK